MSLILEALKKSEQQRRLGEAPTFGSPVVATRKRRSILPVIAILIVVAGGVWWWLGHRTSAPVPATPAPVASTKPAQTPISQQAQPRPATGTVRPAPQRTPPAATAASQDKRAVGVGNVPRTAPVTTAPAATVGIPPAPDKNAGLRAPAPPAPAKTDAVPPAATPKTAGTMPATPPPVAPARQQPPAATTVDTKPAVAPPPAAPAAAGAALPTVWELPYATRKDIPAIELSMHVFSSDPKQRFVVIKGDRHAEGDEVGTDLVLKEIRQDGIVLDYKGQVFFYPRSGR